MSLGYAEKLSYKEDVGTVGTSEIFDPPHVLQQKVSHFFPHCLQITPACNLPLKSLRGGGKIVIVNLQPTPKDKKASLVIHGLVDQVIAGVMHHLNLWIPSYVRVDHFQINLTQFSRLSLAEHVKWSLRVSSVFGPKASLPFIESVEVSFSNRPDLKTAVLHKQPFVIKREMLRTRPFTLVLKLNFSDGCGCKCTIVEFLVNFQEQTDSISYDKDVVVEMLRNTAIESECYGQFSVVEREALPSPKKETVG